MKDLRSLCRIKHRSVGHDTLHCLQFLTFFLKDLQCIRTRDDRHQRLDSLRLFEHIPHQSRRHQRTYSIMDCDNGSVRNLIQGVPYRMKPRESSCYDYLRTGKVAPETIIPPIPDIIRIQNCHHGNSGTSFHKSLDRMLQDSLPPDFKKLLWHRGSHTGTAAGCHNDYISAFSHNFAFDFTKLRNCFNF